MHTEQHHDPYDYSDFRIKKSCMPRMDDPYLRVDWLQGGCDWYTVLQGVLAEENIKLLMESLPDKHLHSIDKVTYIHQNFPFVAYVMGEGYIYNEIAEEDDLSALYEEPTDAAEAGESVEEAHSAPPPAGIAIVTREAATA